MRALGRESASGKANFVRGSQGGIARNPKRRITTKEDRYGVMHALFQAQRGRSPDNVLQLGECETHGRVCRRWWSVWLPSSNDGEGEVLGPGKSQVGVMRQMQR